jgi:multidrug transporter EmrE-like cation transporter
MTTPLSSMVWVVTGSFIGSMGAAGLKAGSKRLEKNFKSLLTNWRLAAGVFAYLVSSVFFVFGLKEGELSVLYPLVSLGYMWTLLWSRLFFGEKVTRFKLVGLALILAGVSLLGVGAARGQDVSGDVSSAQH